MRGPSSSHFRARSRSTSSTSLLFGSGIDDAGPSTSASASLTAAPSSVLPPIEDTSCSESHLRRRREQERRARRELLRKARPPRLVPRGPPLTPSSFATDRFGAFLDAALEAEFWDWLNPQAVKTDATTLLMLFGVVGSTALAFAWQQSPWCLYTGTLLYFVLAVACTKYPDDAARLRTRLMPWVRVSVLLMTVCNTWARKGTPLRPVGFLPSWLGTSAVALDADERDALLLQLQQQGQLLPAGMLPTLAQQQAALFGGGTGASSSSGDPAVPLAFPPRATSLEEASEPANWITFFFKVPRVYAIALPGVGFLLPPRSHALSTLACVVLILGSVKTAAADREAFLGREMHEIVAGVLSGLRTALLGSLSPVVVGSANGSGVVAVAAAANAAAAAGGGAAAGAAVDAAAAAGGGAFASLQSSPPAGLPPLAASLLSSSAATSLITGRRATVAFLAANQVMSCHWVSVIHAALVRRERRRFELMKRAEEEMTETEGEEDAGEDDDDDDADADDADADGDEGNGAAAEKRATTSSALLARRRKQRALSSAKTRLYLGRTAEIDWLIGQATLHAAGWVAIWTAAEAWHRWKSGRLWK